MEKHSPATQIRVPSVANFLVDSADRKSGTPWTFNISKNQSLANGFFTRLGASEVVLEWNLPNVTQVSVGGSYVDQTMTFTLSAGGGPYTVTFVPQFYTVAQVLDTIKTSLNSQTAANRFVIEQLPDGPTAIVDTTGANFTAIAGNGPLVNQMQWAGEGTPDIYPDGPDLRRYRYLDFISPDLTYNQDVKDSTTALTDQNVIVRWYMAYDNPVAADNYGFPVLMGYESFAVRRIYNPPKQIKWDPRMPVGSLAFLVIGTSLDQSVVPGVNKQEVVNANSPGFGNVNSNWLMTIQLSEN
jgi:hypothetical protein